MIRLHLLGSVALVRDDGSSIRSILGRPKCLALLAYLAASYPPSECRRDTLLALFWPAMDQEHARKALRQLLYGLRQAMGPRALIGHGEEFVAVDTSRLWCDAAAFAAAVEKSRHEEALRLYVGPFLHGFHLSGAPEFASWLDTERARLHELACAGATRLANRCEAEGDVGRALHWARRALGLSPYDETVLRRLLELLDRSGDRAGAVREYEAFADRLRDELEVEPSPESRAAIEAIRARATPNKLPLPGRAASLITALPTEPVAEAGDARAPRWRRRVPRLVRVAVAAALLLLAAGGVSIVAKGGADLEPRRVLVIPLENRTGEASLGPVGMIAADWIIQGFARTDVVDVVPSIQALGLLRQVEDEGNEQDGVARARSIAGALGAGTVVVGSYHQSGGDLEFQAQVIDVARDRLLHAVDGVRGSQHDPMAAIDELRRRTVGAVGFQFDPRTSSMVPGHQPPSYEAYQAFAAGVEQRQRMHWQQAVSYFRQAFALDSSFTLGAFMAALDHLNLREHAQADSLVRILARSRERLPTVDRLLLDWAEAELRGDLPGALEAARRFGRFPQLRPQVAHNALSANRPRDAIEVHKSIDIDRNPHPMWQLNFGRRLTDAHHRLGSHRRELAEAKRARKRHADLVEPILWEMRALAGLGRVEDALRRLEEALAMPPASGWPAGEIMLRSADELRAHGHGDVAREILPRALAWYRALPDSQAELPRHRRYRAAALLRADSLGAAETAFRGLAAEFPDDPYYIASVAVVRARRGDRRAATEIAETALNRNPPYDFGHHVYERARIAAQLGEAEHAIALLQRAFADGFDFAFVGGTSSTTSARFPDGAPHLDPAFDNLRTHPGFLELARGKD